MAKFYEGNALNAEIEKLLENAEERIILISPFIKLHARLSFVLRSKIKSHKISIVVVFGKNELDLSRSITIEDLNFFKEFPNIEIRHENRLHAKYYANESTAILTSMNLLNFSHNNNIEAGILLNGSILNALNEDSPAVNARRFFEEVIDQSKLLFRKVPQYESNLLGLSKKYTGSTITIDLLDNLFTTTENDFKVNDNVNGLRTKLSFNNGIANSSQLGYCIRTGKPIPFNISKPMCEEAYSNWVKYKDENYKEKYCHFSGEASNGQTSFRRPILLKNYKNAQTIFNLK